MPIRPNVQPNRIPDVPGNCHITGPVAPSSVQQSSVTCTQTISRKSHVLQKTSNNGSTVGVGSQSQQNNQKFTFRRPAQVAAAPDQKVSNFRAPADGQVRQEEPNDVNREESVDLWEDGKDTIRQIMVKQNFH